MFQQKYCDLLNMGQALIIIVAVSLHWGLLSSDMEVSLSILQHSSGFDPSGKIGWSTLFGLMCLMGLSSVERHNLARVNKR